MTPPLHPHTVLPVTLRLPPHNQRGSTLIVALIMLLLVLMMGITGMRALTMDARMTANALEQQRLFEAADGALRHSERTLALYSQPLSICGTNENVYTKAGEGATQTLPCYISDALTDPDGMQVGFKSHAAQIHEVTGFNRKTAWYPRYIKTSCPKGASATSAINISTTGCTDYYEMNAVSTSASDYNGVDQCNGDSLCVRSVMNLFIK
ncbi:pilus assembly PilX family protein [Corticibacter populi]|nr:PilX N-terminal domain-containing pilus assembly protein [Corticibacter populi]RZS35237.1 type IV pilus assembly protein PilX [Corticibacter populi]